MTVFRLSIEEVAFAMGFVGGADTAAGFLTSLMGQRTSDDLAGRLAAASHSLMARELLMPASSSAEAALHLPLQKAVEGMLKGDDVLHVSVSTEGHERVVTFFLQDGGAVQHELVQGVVSQIALLDATAQALESVAGILTPAGLPPVSAEPVGAVPADRLRQLRQQVLTAMPSDLTSLLAGVSETVAEAVAVVMRDASATWTAALRLKTGEAGSVEASRGVFTVFVSQAGWLFDMSDDSMRAVMYALDHNAAAASIARLLAAEPERG